MGKRLIDRINPLHKGEALPEALSGPLAFELIVREASSLDQLRSTTHFSLAGFQVVSLLTADGKIEEEFVEHRRVFAMEERQIAAIGSFCWNETCEDYQKVNHGDRLPAGIRPIKTRKNLSGKVIRVSFSEDQVLVPALLLGRGYSRPIWRRYDGHGV
jgi:hypothetical protein